MNNWKVVGAKREKRFCNGGTIEKKKNLCMTETEVRAFLENYKVSRCQEDPRDHDLRFCHHFHEQKKDSRRNPYKHPYDVDDCQSIIEKMYHPVAFRTAYCHNGSACLFQSICAHAHSPEELRDRQKATFEYAEFRASFNQQKHVLSAFVPEPKKRDYYSECGILWNEMQLKPQSRFIILTNWQMFLIDRSPSLMQEIQEMALEEGLGCLSKRCSGGRKGLLVTGLHVDAIAEKVKAAFSLPSQHFVKEEYCYSTRVIGSLKNLMQTDDGRRLVSSSANALLELIEADTKVVLYGVNSRNKSGADEVRDVIDKIKFWVRQENYNSFLQCGCCLENHNPDQGISCSNGHFYCSGDQDACFSVSIRAQINLIRSSTAGLVCPDCGVSYSSKDVASNLPTELWNQVQDAIIAKKVETESEKLVRRFDERLEEKIQELMAQYGNADY